MNFYMTLRFTGKLLANTNSQKYAFTKGIFQIHFIQRIFYLRSNMVMISCLLKRGENNNFFIQLLTLSLIKELSEFIKPSKRVLMMVFKNYLMSKAQLLNLLIRKEWNLQSLNTIHFGNSYRILVALK